MDVNSNTPKTFGFQMIWQSLAFLALAAAVGLSVNFFRADRLELPGDWSAEARTTLDTGENIAISVEAAKQLFDTGEAIFLDARPAESYADGHIQGARSFPWDAFDDYFDPVMADVTGETTLIAYCDGESCTLSHDLAKALMEMGFPKARVLVNGWTLWQQSGFPAELSEITE
ncbi:hypothetical protein DENIS_0945 [Desulfonema ishimotonii]|uniref:Rhodanese domain-containing protein n=1 Tax=Desulfonema ishimotonii TaxID=45657 RepID=A0A401FSS2_9BACT|nr:rhodanese-like domain-containing protein [Desulfonema ishimotonii]GBC60003.1 hypothetical protein DENIS_0945 [Desulfonema ishimotonii]